MYIPLKIIVHLKVIIASAGDTYIFHQRKYRRYFF